MDSAPFINSPIQLGLGAEAGGVCEVVRGVRSALGGAT